MNNQNTALGVFSFILSILVVAVLVNALQEKDPTPEYRWTVTCDDEVIFKDVFSAWTDDGWINIRENDLSHPNEPVGIEYKPPVDAKCTITTKEVTRNEH